MQEAIFNYKVISDAALWMVPGRWTKRDVVVLKFGGTTAGSSQNEGRIRLARKTIADLVADGKTVIPVFSAYRRGRSQSSKKISVTDILQNYRRTIASFGDLQDGAKHFEKQLTDIHFQLIDELKLEDDSELGCDIADELERITQTALISCTSCEASPSLDDLILTAGERLIVRIMASYFNRSHRENKFPMPAKAVTAMELGIYTDNAFGDATIQWAHAIESTRETIFENYIEQGVMPIVSGFDGIYDPTDEFAVNPQQEVSQSEQGLHGSVFRTSLGRGGSDLTATFLGLALDAEYVGFCKETPGVLSADDQLVGESAQRLPALDYELATEAGNIYHKAIEPVRAGNVPVHIFDPKSPNERTVISNQLLKHGIYLVQHPAKTVNLHVSQISDRPGELSRLLQLVGDHNVNVEEVRHQRSGTDCIVAGDKTNIHAMMQKLSQLGYQLHAEFTWYVRAIGIINEQLAADFDKFMSSHAPLTLSTYQFGTRVLTATVARHPEIEHDQELGRAKELVRALHDHLIPSAISRSDNRQPSQSDNAIQPMNISIDDRTPNAQTPSRS